MCDGAISKQAVCCISVSISPCSSQIVSVDHWHHAKVIHGAISDMDAHLSAAAPGLDDDESSEEEVDAPMWS